MPLCRVRIKNILNCFNYFLNLEILTFDFLFCKLLYVNHNHSTIKDEDFIGKWRQLLYIILGASIALFLITTTFLFYHRRKQIKDAENRSMRLSITLAISNVIFCPLL